MPVRPGASELRLLSLEITGSPDRNLRSASALDAFVYEPRIVGHVGDLSQFCRRLTSNTHLTSTGASGTPALGLRHCNLANRTQYVNNIKSVSPALDPR